MRAVEHRVDDSFGRSSVRDVRAGLHTEQAAHRVQRVALNGLDHLDVGAGGHGDGAVPQDSLHSGGLHAHREEQPAGRIRAGSGTPAGDCEGQPAAVGIDQESFRGTDGGEPQRDIDPAMGNRAYRLSLHRE